MNASAPCIDINLRWINASDVPNNRSVGNPAYSDVNQNSFILDSYGTIGILRDTVANGSLEIPTNASIFLGKRYVWVRLGSLRPGQRMEDGSMSSNETLCPSTSVYFGKLPDVEQYRSTWSWSDPAKEWAATDCYIVAEAAITAGRQSATGCTISSFDASKQYATCKSTLETAGVQKDWLTNLALAFTSEVMKFTVMQNLTLPLMTNHSIDDYTVATLALGYHASWNVLMKFLGNATESTTYLAAEPVVQAQINHSKLAGWFGMNAALTVSALLFVFAQLTTKTKTIRDSTLAAMFIDLNASTHSACTAEGLCNAVTLSKKDKKLPRMIWDCSDDGKVLKPTAISGQVLAHDHGTNRCHRRVVFVDDDNS